MTNILEQRQRAEQILSTNFSLPTTMKIKDVVLLAKVMTSIFSEQKPSDRARTLQTLCNAYAAKADNDFGDNTKECIRLMLLAILDPGQIDDIISAINAGPATQNPRSKVIPLHKPSS